MPIEPDDLCRNKAAIIERSRMTGGVRLSFFVPGCGQEGAPRSRRLGYHGVGVEA